MGQSHGQQARLQRKSIYKLAFKKQNRVSDDERDVLYRSTDSASLTRAYHSA
ncbi:hypothetical protein GCM10008094_02690 [Aidingimonas halophila]|nr:hypothetical protein GCM10008094_02690 [Aidingimonas halophila]